MQLALYCRQPQPAAVQAALVISSAADQIEDGGAGVHSVDRHVNYTGV